LREGGAANPAAMLRLAVFVLLFAVMLGLLAIVALVGRMFGILAMWGLVGLITVLALYAERHAPMSDLDTWIFPRPGTPRLPPARRPALPPPDRRMLPPTSRSNSRRKALPPR
jgi:hypothetical protein